MLAQNPGGKMSKRRASKTCYIVSVGDYARGNDESKRDTILSRQPICGDILGLGYEFTLPKKNLLVMKKPGIVVTNLVGL